MKSSLYFYRLVFGVGLLLLWQVASGWLVSPVYISSPVAVAGRLSDLIASGELFRHARITAFEAIAGFLLGSGVAIVVGLVLGRARRLAEVLDPFIMGFYSLPKIALAPLFVMWFGIDMSMKIIFTAAVVFLVVFLNTYSGVRSVSPEQQTVFRLMGATERQVVRMVIIPAALTWVFVGLRLSAPYALVGAIVGEIIAGNRGLGYLVARTTAQFDTAGAFAAIAAIVTLGVLLNMGIKALERSLMPWRQMEDAREVAI